MAKLIKYVNVNMQRPAMKPSNRKTARSQLQTHIVILKVLAHLGPFKLRQMASEVDLNSHSLKAYLDFLIKQGMVEEQTIRRGSAVFAVTQRGINVLKFFKEYTQGISVVEEA